MNRVVYGMWLHKLVTSGIPQDQVQAILDRLARLWLTQATKPLDNDEAVLPFLCQLLSHPSERLSVHDHFTCNINGDTCALILALKRDLLSLVSGNSSLWKAGYCRMSSQYRRHALVDSETPGNLSQLSFQLDPFALNK